MSNCVRCFIVSAYQYSNACRVSELWSQLLGWGAQRALSYCPTGIMRSGSKSLDKTVHSGTAFARTRAVKQPLESQSPKPALSTKAPSSK